MARNSNDSMLNEEVDSIGLGRRDFGAIGLLAATSFNHGFKIARDVYVHGWTYGDPEAREDETHIPTLRKVEAQNKLDLNIVNLCLEPRNSINHGEDLSIIENRLSGLKENLDVDASSYVLELNDYRDSIEETTVKQSEGLIRGIQNYLIEENLNRFEEDDIVMYVADFDTENGDYIGTSHQDSNAGAIANKYDNKAHKLNQILHNTGHKLGLPHTITEDVMTWSPLKKVTSFRHVHGFSQESRDNLEKSINYHLEN